MICNAVQKAKAFAGIAVEPRSWIRMLRVHWTVQTEAGAFGLDIQSGTAGHSCARHYWQPIATRSIHRGESVGVRGRGQIQVQKT